MPNDPMHQPEYVSPPRLVKPGARLFEVLRGSQRIRCELSDQGKYGVEAQMYRNEELWYSRRFPKRKLAVEWAELERAAIERGLR